MKLTTIDNAIRNLIRSNIELIKENKIEQVIGSQDIPIQVELVRYFKAAGYEEERLILDSSSVAAELREHIIKYLKVYFNKELPVIIREFKHHKHSTNTFKYSATVFINSEDYIFENREIVRNTDLISPLELEARDMVEYILPY